MGNLASTSRKQQKKNVEEVIRGIVEGIALVFILRAEVSAGLRNAFGIEASVFIAVVLLHLMWEEFGEPFSGIVNWITGLFITDR